MPDACLVPEAFVVPDDCAAETVLVALGLFALVVVGLDLLAVVVAAAGAATIGICPSSGDEPGR